MTNPAETKTPKPKGPTQTERVLARMEGATTDDLISQVIDFAGNPVFQLLEDSQDPSKAKTLAEAFADPSTGGITLYGTQLPMLDGFKEVALDATLLGSSYRKYQQGRKALALALEHLNNVDAKVQQDVIKRTNAIIKKQKGGASLVQNFTRHLRVSDLDFFGPGEIKNNIQFTTSGTFITLGVELPPQSFDVSAELELLGDSFNELEAQRLLQKEITSHVAAMTNHLPTLAMASGLNADPSATDAETGKPLGVDIHRLLTVKAQLWHGTGTVPARQWSLTQRGDGKFNSKKQEVLKFMDLVQEDKSFPGAADGTLVISVSLAYRLKVKRSELDDVINGLGMLVGTDMPIYRGAEAGATLEEHYRTIGITQDEEPDTEDEDADVETIDSVQEEVQNDDQADEETASVDSTSAPEPAAPAPVPAPAIEPEDGDLFTF